MLNHPPKLNEEHDPFKVYNIGNNHPVRLMKFIEILEDAIGRKAERVPAHADGRRVSDVC